MLETLQKEHSAWAARNSAELIPSLAALGIFEEACELLRVAVKLRALEVRGTKVRYTEEELTRMLADAVGDCAVYCCSRCTASGVDFSTAVRHAGMPPKSEPLLDACWRVLEAARGVVEAPQDKLAVVWVLSALQDTVRSVGLDFERCVTEAWSVVQARRPDRL